MTKVQKSAKAKPYEQEGTRVISLRVMPETLRSLRLIAVEQDRSVCDLMREQAERLVELSA